MAHAFLTFCWELSEQSPLFVFLPCSEVATNFGFPTIYTGGPEGEVNSPAFKITDISEMTIYLGKKKSSGGSGGSEGGGTVTPEPTPVGDWNLDNMVAESYAMRDMDGYRAFGVRGITGSTPVVTKAKVTYDSGGSWEWTVTDNDPNLKAQYFDNAWPNSVAGEDTRKITLYDADGNEVISKTGFTVEMKTYIGESDWNVDNVTVEIDTNNGEIAPDVTIRGITGSTPTCTKIRFRKDGDTTTVDVAVSNNNPNVTAVSTSTYLSMQLYNMDDRRMDLLSSNGDILATKIGWEVNRHN